MRSLAMQLYRWKNTYLRQRKLKKFCHLIKKHRTLDRIA